VLKFSRKHCAGENQCIALSNSRSCVTPDVELKTFGHSVVALYVKWNGCSPVRTSCSNAGSGRVRRCSSSASAVGAQPKIASRYIGIDYSQGWLELARRVIHGSISASAPPDLRNDGGDRAESGLSLDEDFPLVARAALSRCYIDSDLAEQGYSLGLRGTL